MPSSPIAKKLDVLPDNWVHLQKTMIPDQATACYWSVWYDHKGTKSVEFPILREDVDVGTASSGNAPKTPEIGKGGIVDITV